jgi:phenylpropionate dioxygenase-like ring-hydroxylating dioxygenase large terminal subunit
MTTLDSKRTEFIHTRATAEDRSFPTTEDYIAEDTREVPSVLLEPNVQADVGSHPISTDSYVSADYVRLEYEQLWPKVWQMACREREIPNPGDFYEYQIGDQSVLVVRAEDSSIRAYQNSCMHRGTKLKSGCGHATDLRCRFHSWTWNLDGSIKNIPSRWDFPDVRDSEVGLIPVKADTWQGFVFINFDTSAAPLSDFLGETVRRHFDAMPLTDAVKLVHAVKHVNINWKNALNAFTESYHVFSAHPQVVNFVADCNSRYDTYGLHGRMHTCLGAPSPYLDFPVDGQTTVDSLLEENLADALGGASEGIELPQVEPGESPRAALAEFVRAQMAQRIGGDFSDLSDTALLDGIQYFVFPNFCPWWSVAFPMVYRARPLGDDPNWCIFEAILLARFPAGEQPPADAPVRFLGPDEPWSNVEELGALGRILDQDVTNMEYQQAGMRNRGLKSLWYAKYQESIPKQFAEDLARFVGR